VKEEHLLRPGSYVLLALAGLLGGGSLIMFVIFLYAGSLRITNLGLDRDGILCLDAALSLLFFTQHSGMVRKSFRQRLSRLVPEEFFGAVYAAASGTALLLVVLLWQEGEQLFSLPPGGFRPAFRALFLLSLAGFIWGGLSLKSFDPMGIRPLLAGLRGIKPAKMPFSARGAYRLVRHPLYLFTILMIWSRPDLTRDRLLFNLLWTGWIVIGAFLEERDLTAEFGDTYREYRRRVPMFIPGWTFFRRKGPEKLPEGSIRRRVSRR